jgi:hypothetical protein
MYTQEEAQLAQTAKANWYDRARFEAEILPKFRAWEIDVEGNIQEAPAKPKSMADVIGWTAKGNIQKVAETIQGWTTWAIRWLGNIASFATRQAANIPNLATKLTGQGTPASDFLNPLAQRISSWAEKLASWIESTTQTLGGLNPQSPYSKAWQFAWQTALTAPIGGIASKAVTTAWKVGLGALEWALQWGTFDVASQWKLWAWAIAGWVLWAGMPAIGSAYNKFSNWVTDKLPKSLVSSGLVTPSALKNASERLSRLADDWVVDMEAAPQWMLSKNLSGSKEKLQTQLTDIIKNSGVQKKALLANNETSFGTVQAIKDLKKWMREVLPNFAKISGKKVKPTAWNAELVKEILAFTKNTNPTAKDIERARSLLGNMWIFTKWGALADSAQKEWLQRVWINVSKFMDKNFKWFRELNKDIEVATALKDAIGLKQAQQEASKILTMTNLWTGGAWASYWYAKEWDVSGALKYGAWAIAGKALLNNPAFTTGLAQTLKSPMLKEWLKQTGKVVKKALKYAPQVISNMTQ